MEQVRSGDWTVTRLVDGALTLKPDDFPGAGLSGPVRLTVNAYLIEGPEGPVLVDAGCGNFWDQDAGFLVAALAAHGLVPEAIGTVIFTHLHSDHCGGAISGDARVFPNAEIVLSADEAEWMAPKLHPGGQVLRAYDGHVRTVTGAGEILPGLTAWPIPGHTPGQIAIRVGPDVVLTGDLVHLPQQLESPQIGTVFDSDPAAALISRQSALAEIAASGLLFAGGHIGGAADAAFGRLVPDGEGYRRTR